MCNKKSFLNYILLLVVLVPLCMRAMEKGTPKPATLVPANRSKLEENLLSAIRKDNHEAAFTALKNLWIFDKEFYGQSWDELRSLNYLRSLIDQIFAESLVSGRLSSTTITELHKHIDTREGDIRKTQQENELKQLVKYAEEKIEKQLASDEYKKYDLNNPDEREEKLNFVKKLSLDILDPLLQKVKGHPLLEEHVKKLIKDLRQTGKAILG